MVRTVRARVDVSSVDLGGIGRAHRHMAVDPEREDVRRRHDDHEDRDQHGSRPH